MAERTPKGLSKVRECLPPHISLEDREKIMKLMEPVAPLAESFRADDLYGLIDEILDEMSSMSGGNVQGAATSSTGKGPWANLDVEEENEEQAEDAKLKGDVNALIHEVANYLINAGA
jgi:hypothetical protein